jgi:putative oxidoreductase
MTLRVIHWLSRCILGVVFIYSGYVKAQATLQFAVALTGYKLIPERLIWPIATYFPWVEIVLGIVLLTGWKIRYVSAGTTLLLLFFMAILTSTLFRGIETDCGCFGFGDPISALTIARDSMFLIPALYLVFEPRFRMRSRNTMLESSSVAQNVE